MTRNTSAQEYVDQNKDVLIWMSSHDNLIGETVAITSYTELPFSLSEINGSLAGNQWNWDGRNNSQFLRIVMHSNRELWVRKVFLHAKCELKEDLVDAFCQKLGISLDELNIAKK